jgi:hypothetical protein
MSQRPHVGRGREGVFAVGVASHRHVASTNIVKNLRPSNAVEPHCNNCDVYTIAFCRHAVAPLLTMRAALNLNMFCVA